MKTISIFALLLLVMGCNTEVKINSTKAVDIIDESIKVSGSEKLDSTTVIFKFREKMYTATRNQGEFKLERTFTELNKDKPIEIRDVLGNSDFKRFSNGEEVQLSNSDKARFSASVNSVHYFSVLPYGLDGKAVYKTMKDSVTIKGRLYQTVEVTFDEEGGGEDYDDVFLYWVDNETYKINYLAYSYNEPKGRGLRFREAYNERYVNGVRFVDYKNYKPKNEFVELSELPILFEKGELKLLSKIELENVMVN